MSSRRPSAALIEFGERLYAAMYNTPGDMMTVLGGSGLLGARAALGSMSLSKQTGRVPNVGNAGATRYYPITGG